MLYTYLRVVQTIRKLYVDAVKFRLIGVMMR